MCVCVCRRACVWVCLNFWESWQTLTSETCSYALCADLSMGPRWGVTGVASPQPRLGLLHPPRPPAMGGDWADDQGRPCSR